MADTPNYSQLAWQAATDLSSELGVSPNLIYGQFAYETGNFSNVHGGFNFGNIMTSGGKTPASYDSLQAFEDSYASTLESIYPASTTTGDNAAAFVSGLYSGSVGQGQYSTTATQAQYLAGVQTYSDQAPVSGDTSSFWDALNSAAGTGQAGVSKQEIDTAGQQSWFKNLTGFDLVDIGIAAFGIAIILIALWRPLTSAAGSATKVAAVTA